MLSLILSFLACYYTSTKTGHVPQDQLRTWPVLYFHSISEHNKSTDLIDSAMRLIVNYMVTK